nr:cyclophilin-like fold protein [Arthrobacter sp. ok362]
MLQRLRWTGKARRVPEPLSLDGVPAADDADPRTIGYYAPGQVLVLYYEHVGYFSARLLLGIVAGQFADDAVSATIWTPWNLSPACVKYL